jgi:hypothetical protein
MLGCTPFTRLTNALSKKVQNYAHAAPDGNYTVR